MRLVPALDRRCDKTLDFPLTRPQGLAQRRSHLLPRARRRSQCLSVLSDIVDVSTIPPLLQKLHKTLECLERCFQPLLARPLTAYELVRPPEGPERVKAVSGMARCFSRASFIGLGSLDSLGFHPGPPFLAPFLRLAPLLLFSVPLLRLALLLLLLAPFLRLALLLLLALLSNLVVLPGLALVTPVLWNPTR